MEYFAIGIVSLVFAVLFPVIYFIGLQFRRLRAWSKRNSAPKDRIGIFLLIAAGIGFGVGGFAQPLWNKAIWCKAADQPVVLCVLFSW